MPLRPRPRGLPAALALVLTLGGCVDPLGSVLDQCALVVDLTPSEGPVGTEVVALGGPFSNPSDTIVRVGGVDARVLGVERQDCLVCDACRLDQDCTSCDTCDACAVECEPCEQTVTFQVPEVPAGERAVVVLNRHGNGDDATFTVLGNGTPLETDSATETDTLPLPTGDTAGSGDTLDTGRDTDSDGALLPTGDTDTAVDSDTDSDTAVDTDTAIDSDTAVDTDSDSDTAVDTDTDTAVDSDTAP